MSFFHVKGQGVEGLLYGRAAIPPFGLLLHGETMTERIPLVAKTLHRQSTLQTRE